MTHFCLWKPKNNGPAALKWVFQYMETINKYVWIGMARMEIASNLKTSGRIFQVSALVSQIKFLKTNFGLFFLLKIHFILSPWWSKSNSCVSQVLWCKLIKIVTKKIGKSPWDWPFNTPSLIPCDFTIWVSICVHCNYASSKWISFALRGLSQKQP